MSKSTGGFLRLQTIVDWGIHPLSYRYFTLMAHYRSQLEFSSAALVSAQSALTRLLKQVQELRREARSTEWTQLVQESRFGRGGLQSALDVVVARARKPA